MKKILFVCLGNICHSPMAEFVMKTWQDVLAGCQGLLRELLQERGEQNG